MACCEIYVKIRGLLDKFVALRIYGVARCNLTFLSIIILRMFWHMTIICVVFSDLKNKLNKNLCNHAIYSWCGKIKKSHWVPTQGCAAIDPSIRDFGWSKRRWFQPMCENSHFHCEQWFFSCSFYEFLQRNCGVPLKMERCSSGTVATWPFASKCFFPKQFLLDFACLRRPSRTTLFLCFGFICIDP